MPIRRQFQYEEQPRHLLQQVSGVCTLLLSFISSALATVTHESVIALKQATTASTAFFLSNFCERIADGAR